MIKRFTLFLACLLSLATASADLSDYDLNAPMGWATCASMTTAGDYQITGGGNGKSITLYASGDDDLNQIKNAIANYDIIIFDGSKGDFIMSKSLEIKTSNRSLIGINQARLCTKFYVTDEITKLMDDNNVKSLSTSGSGFKLSNGTSVSEQREATVRQLLIDYTGDSSEAYRSSGIFTIKGCSNLIVRNIDFAGPGSIDVGGSDLLSILSSAHHIWVDHCQFTDGMDGNFDITNKADFVTVSWCVFKYTKRSYDHQNTNLIGGSDTASKQGEDNLNVTFANNMWGEMCNARMPMARFGTIHLLNNYYNCAGNGSAAMNPRKNSEFLIEGNYFEKGVKKIFSQSSAKAYVFKDNHYTESFSQPADKGSVTLPYEYTAYAAALVPEVVASTLNGAGPTLTDPLTIGRQTSLEAIDKAAYSYTDGFFRTEGKIYLYDLCGKCLQISENEMDMSSLEEGIYLLKAKNVCIKLKR